MSRLELNTTRRSTMRALSSPAVIHGALESCFAGERQHPLWRLDTLNNKQYLLVVSEEKPDLTTAAQQFGHHDQAGESRYYAPLLARIAPDTRYHFRLTANPTYSRQGKELGEGVHARGTVCAHKTTAHQIAWLMKQSEKCGFSLKEEEFTVTKSQWMHFQKGKDGGRRITLLSVTYEGVLTVTDAERFREVLTSGIGREKAYGMGLMTVVPCRG